MVSVHKRIPAVLRSASVPPHQLAPALFELVPLSSTHRDEEAGLAHSTFSSSAGHVYERLSAI
jgi:hypothetical protein